MLFFEVDKSTRLTLQGLVMTSLIDLTPEQISSHVWTIELTREQTNKYLNLQANKNLGTCRIFESAPHGRVIWIFNLRARYVPNRTFIRAQLFQSSSL